MTPSRIERLPFAQDEIRDWSRRDRAHTDWPVVYVLDGDRSQTKPAVYVGETLNAAARMRQHLANASKRATGLETIRVVVDDRFNKSVCLDLESHLIRWLAGDGRFTVLNGNEGITDASYYDRDVYRESFRDVFEQLRADGVFERTIPQIENGDLFKLSPFKALTNDQAAAVEDILEGIFADLATGAESTAVVQGHPGTGKTIVAIFLMKLLADIRDHDADDEVQPDSVFADLFVPEHRALLQGFRMALVVPQQSLRLSIQRVFAKTPKLHPSMVVSPWDVGRSAESYDLLVVDETHRLNQRANQSSGVLNRDFARINERLFGADDPSKTQLDWITARSAHRVLLVDGEQSVRPADLPATMLAAEVRAAAALGRRYPLLTQMRVNAGTDYVDAIRGILRGEDGARLTADALGEYELRFFQDLGDMREAIRRRDDEHGLARLVAGYAWDWRSRRDPAAHDIELDGVALRWNRTDKDWINAPGSLDEVGSIHTVQGYDLNYAGVIIGPDLRLDPASGRLRVDRDSYRDKKGKENNPALGIVYSDDDLLQYIRNIYGVLLTRGIRGTFVYVCDPALREWMRERLTG
ncbi:DNA/RNA helicase domain-containing protein [Microbacterium gilvum]|uniref:GIY-YIG domain-containing protein n=1 Tax=Microbacterium gilvum TaxID=1336204 RepID=A0ABP9A4L1_9MICO